MRNKRMFSLDVVDSDRFLDMPISTQALYFHLWIRSDSDNFISAPRAIARSLNAKGSDLEILAEKGYLQMTATGARIVTQNSGRKAGEA